MLVKIHRNENGKTVAAICDKDLIGKRLEEKDIQLDLCSDFYKGEEEAVDVIADMIRNADIVNMVGKKSVSLGLKEGILEEKEIKIVQGIPHARVLLID